MSVDLNCLSYWFPKLLSADLPVPRTEIVRADCQLLDLLDGKMPAGFLDFRDKLLTACDKIGWPCFLRTGLTSGKHRWRDTCYLETVDDIESHIAALVEFSAMADFIGLPCDVWAVRETLPTMPLFHAFRDMPICREFRCFVGAAGEVYCIHPYWPREALEEGLRELFKNWPADYNLLCTMYGQEEHMIRRLASAAGKAIGNGWWSVDVLYTEFGWYVTDCAVAAQSFHWPGCEKAKEMAE